MAVVTTKSTAITNRDAIPRVTTDNKLAAAVSKAAQGYVSAANGDSIGSKYVVAALPSNAIVQQVLLTCEAITSGAADVGVYKPTAVDGTAGAVVSAGLFGTAVSIATALNNSDITNESTTYTLDKRDQPLWQAAGLSADPGGQLDIALTLTAATTAAGKVGLTVFYVDGGS